MLLTSFVLHGERLLNLPYNSHSYLLPLPTDTLPIFVEICRRSARFILKCLNNASSLVQTVVRHGIHLARYKSCVGRNLLFVATNLNGN